MLHPDRYLSPDPGVRKIARELLEKASTLPLVCPHGHVDPWILAKNTPFPDPTNLIVIPDHYIFRMLYSQGIPLEGIGIGSASGKRSREIWQLFGDSSYLFRGTPTSCWLRHEFAEVFGITEALDGSTAMDIYDRIAAQLEKPEFLPRRLFDRFNIEVLTTTDAATDTLDAHREIRESGWSGKVFPTFRPDAVINLLNPSWRAEIDRLSEVSGKDATSYRGYIQALESRREFFKSMGATATDHGVTSPYTCRLTDGEASAIFERALGGDASQSDDAAFTAHMLIEMARMSVEDGLVMQLHPGSYRNHNRVLFERFGPDMGCDIPLATEYTRNLAELLNLFGNHPNFRFVVFTLDESTFSRELAPLAGHYPAMRLGPPWWFHDSIDGMRRFRRTVTETAGIYNTAGFNDDTRAFPSIPARHDLCRRVDANFLAELVCEYVIDLEDAHEMIVDLSYRLAKDTYRFE